MEITKLIRDYEIYPRTDVSETHVRRIADVIEAGVKIPPVKVQKKTMRIIDGFHRIRAHELLKLTEIEVELIECNDIEAYKIAVESNNSHGRGFTPYDYRRIILKFEDLGITIDRVVDILHIRKEKIEGITKTFARTAEGDSIPLKRTINFMAGKQLTKRQEQANKKLGGMSALFWVNQLIELIEADLWQADNPKLNERMDHLMKLWESKKVNV